MDWSRLALVRLLIHATERKKERKKIRSDQSYVAGYIHV